MKIKNTSPNNTRISQTSDGLLGYDTKVVWLLGTWRIILPPYAV